MNDNVTINVPIGTKPLGASREEAAVPNCHTRMGIRRTGGLVLLIPTRLRGVSWDILHVKPLPAFGSPTLTHPMRPRSEKKVQSVYQ